MSAYKLLILIGVSLQAWDITATAVIFRQPPIDKPAYCAHEEGCYSSITKKVIAFGLDVYPLAVCKKLSCQTDGYTIITSCEEKVVPRGCRLSTDSKLQYPHCCGKVVCPRYDTYDTYDDYDTYDYDYPKDLYYDDYYYNVRPQRYRRGGVVGSQRYRRGGVVGSQTAQRDVEVVPQKPVKKPKRKLVVDNYKGAIDDGRGDNYKLKEDQKVLYDNTDESSRRAPGDKREHIDARLTPKFKAVGPKGSVIHYEVDNSGDDYKRKDNQKIVYDNKDVSSRRAPYDKDGDISAHLVPKYSVINSEGDRVDHYKVDNRGDDYKLQEKKKVVYDDEDVSSRKSPLDKNGGDKNKRRNQRKFVDDKKKETSIRAPWNKHKVIKHGSTKTKPEYHADDKGGHVVENYNPDTRGDDYKLVEEKKDYFNDADEQVPGKNSDAEEEFYEDDGFPNDDGRGDNYKLKETKGVRSVDHKTVTSKRSPWNDNENV